MTTLNENGYEWAPQDYNRPRDYRFVFDLATVLNEHEIVIHYLDHVGFFEDPIGSIFGDIVWRQRVVGRSHGIDPSVQVWGFYPRARHPAEIPSYQVLGAWREHPPNVPGIWRPSAPVEHINNGGAEIFRFRLPGGEIDTLTITLA
jgi:hypothetical protein